MTQCQKHVVVQVYDNVISDIRVDTSEARQKHVLSKIQGAGAGWNLPSDPGREPGGGAVPVGKLRRCVGHTLAEWLKVRVIFTV